MKYMLRNYKVMALLSTCLLWIYCDKDADIVGSDDNVSNTNFIASRTFSFEVDIVNQSRLSLESINGSVVITGRTGVNSAVITGERKVGSESIEDAEAHLEELEVSVSDLGNEIHVQTTQPSETHGRSYTVNYDITLPNNMEVMTTSINGNVEIDSIGNLVTTGLTNGQVILDEISGNTDIDLTNGNINAEIVLPLDGTMDMDITNGNIDLDIPINTSATFSAGVVNGLITISDNLTIHNPTSTPTSQSGTLGDGRGTITLNTTNGNIDVTGF